MQISDLIQWYFANHGDFIQSFQIPLPIFRTFEWKLGFDHHWLTFKVALDGSGNFTEVMCKELFHMLPMSQNKLSPLLQQLITGLLEVHWQCRQRAQWMLWNPDNERSPCTKMLTSCIRVSNVLGCVPASETFTGWLQHKQFQRQLIALENTVVVVISTHKIDGDIKWCLGTWWL